jgi:nucleoside-diphosphate-sugar epimerase
LAEIKTLVVGKNSFISKNLSSAFDKISYKSLNTVDLSKYDVVVNCALDPLYKTTKYDEIQDVDFEVGVKACQSNCHYVMLSTSKVYGQSSELMVYDESSNLNPFDYHGENKAKTELKLFSTFPNQVTILRGSNIFGLEYGRNSFVGYCMSQLVNKGKIELTLAENTKRDFLFVKDAAEIMEKVCVEKPIGVFNLSSNYGLEIGQVIKNLIDGYVHGGIIEKTGFELQRQFILDNSKLKTALNVDIGPFDFDNIFRNLGKQL